jgi:hypothetical protein
MFVDQLELQKLGFKRRRINNLRLLTALFCPHQI